MEWFKDYNTIHHIKMLLLLNVQNIFMTNIVFIRLILYLTYIFICIYDRNNLNLYQGLSVSKPESKEKYKNKYNIKDIYPYPMQLHP